MKERDIKHENGDFLVWIESRHRALQLSGEERSEGMKAIPSNKITEVAAMLNLIAVIDAKIAEIGAADDEYDVRTNNAAGVSTPFMQVRSHELVAVMNERKTIVLEQLAEIGVVIEDGKGAGA